MHDGERGLVVVDHVLHGLAHKPLGALSGDRLDANARGLGETDLLDPKILHEDLDEPLGLRRLGCVLNAGVDVLGVLPENDHVGLLGLFQGAGHALEIAHRPQADIEVELLAKGHIQRPNATTHWRGKRALDGDHVVAQDLEGLVGQPDVWAIDLGGLLATEDFHPGDLAAAAIGLLYGSIDHLDHDRGDVSTRAIALNERNDGLVGHLEGVVGIDRDLLPDGWHDDFAAHGHTLRMKKFAGPVF